MMASDDEIRSSADVKGAASAYSTGGGGVVLEHTFGATLLAALLLGDPIPGLGDEQTVVSVAFQASKISRVDDFVVVGETRGQTRGSGRQLSIGVRRNPRIVPSDQSFVELLGDYVRMVQSDWARIDAGRLHLGLAVASPNTGVQELAVLTDFARAHPSNGDFRGAVAAPQATTNSVRKRLELFDRAVAEAAKATGPELDSNAGSELTWRLLVGLYAIQTRLEGDAPADRTSTIARLREICGDASAADSLFSQLERQAARYAPIAADVTEAMLRRDLSGVAALNRSPSFSGAWNVLDDLGRRLRERTGHELRSGAGDHHLSLQRSEIRDSLVAAMTRAGTEGVPLIIAGEPDVGKSALTLAATAELISRGEAVIALSLRDLPPSVVEVNEALGTPLRMVLGAMAVSPARLLVVDGAEAALEDRFELLRELGESARSGGIGLVAVTRSDARSQIADALTPKMSSTPDRPMEMDVPHLTAREMQEVVAAFPALSHIAREPRSAWLLVRPGLVDLILRADVIAALPDRPLSEADVFAAVWSRLIRRSERNDLGRGSPDGREYALVELARRELLTSSSLQLAGDAAALPSLRSDGLLLAPGPTSAWSRGDQFTNDLIRDFAVARLLLRDGWSPLLDAQAPRWALRAARLACQARLADSGLAAEGTRLELQGVFNVLGSKHGDRWSDLPLEALITLGTPHDALEAAWPALAAGSGEELERLLRLVLQRFTTTAEVADAILIQPVVQLLLDHAPELSKFTPEVRESGREIEVRWLRGLALRGSADSSNELRMRLRDRLLARTPRWRDDRALECLALLGPDLNAAVEDHLRALAIDAPHSLAPCVESVPGSISMAHHRPELLLTIAEAYYIEDPELAHHRSVLDDGIRSHAKLGGIGVPMAAWYYGPFWHLLRATPWQTLAFVNRMLDRASSVRVAHLVELENDLGNAENMHDLDRRVLSGAGITVALPGMSPRVFIGDDHVWAWYRGSTVGPYPCMSALLAVERFVDQAFALGLDLKTIVAHLLDGCHNLAMSGLVVGFLVRHLEDVTDELDPWLAEPSVWELEFNRAIREGRLHAQGRDADEVHGRQRRAMTLREAAAELACRAVTAGDEASMTRLRSAADDLERRASAIHDADLSSPVHQDWMATVRIWGSFLRPESYTTVELPDGGMECYYSPPDMSETTLVRQREHTRGMEVLRLLNAYAANDDRYPPDISNLANDLELAIELDTDPPPQGRPFAANAFAAVAAVAVIAYADGRLDSERAHLAWAITKLIEAATRTPGRSEYDPSIFGMGSDRSAALAIPCLLLPPFEESDPRWFEDEEKVVVHEALARLLTSGSGEVRLRTATALNRIWQAPCVQTGRELARCRHVVAFELVERSVRYCRLGPFDYQTQSRRLVPIEGVLSQELDKIDGGDLLAERLTALLVAAGTCSISNCCVAQDALPLRDVLVRAHAKAVVFQVHEDYQWDHNPDAQEAVAASLLTVAGAGDIGILQTYVDIMAVESAALYLLLHEVARVATYDVVQRANLRTVWPPVMATALGVIEARVRDRQTEHYDDRYLDEAIASLVPRPQIRLNDTDIDATLDGVKGDWLNLDILEPLIRRWLVLAVGRPACVDNMVGAVDTLSRSAQAVQGFDWIVQVIGGRYEDVASRTYLLPNWLKLLGASRMLDKTRLSEYQRLIDGLAAQGDRRAVDLQKSLEQ